jgi:hypothetical protein
MLSESEGDASQMAGVFEHCHFMKNKAIGFADHVSVLGEPVVALVSCLFDVEPAVVSQFGVALNVPKGTVFTNSTIIQCPPGFIVFYFSRFFGCIGTVDVLCVSNCDYAHADLMCSVSRRDLQPQSWCVGGLRGREAHLSAVLFRRQLSRWQRGRSRRRSVGCCDRRPAIRFDGHRPKLG